MLMLVLVLVLFVFVFVLRAWLGCEGLCSYDYSHAQTEYTPPQMSTPDDIFFRFATIVYHRGYVEYHTPYGGQPENNVELRS